MRTHADKLAKRLGVGWQDHLGTYERMLKLIDRPGRNRGPEVGHPQARPNVAIPGRSRRPRSRAPSRFTRKARVAGHIQGGGTIGHPLVVEVLDGGHFLIHHHADPQDVGTFARAIQARGGGIGGGSVGARHPGWRRLQAAAPPNQRQARRGVSKAWFGKIVARGRGGGCPPGTEPCGTTPSGRVRCCPSG